MAESLKDQDSYLLGLKEAPGHGDGDHKVDLTFAKEKLDMVDLSQDRICGPNNQLQDWIGSKVLDSHIRSDSRRDLRPPRRGDNYPYGNETRT